MGILNFPSENWPLLTHVISSAGYRNHQQICDENVFYSDWLKMFGEIFRHEKVEMIPTFSSRNISPHFAGKNQNKRKCACSVDFSIELANNFASWKPAFML